MEQSADDDAPPPAKVARKNRWDTPVTAAAAAANGAANGAAPTSSAYSAGTATASSSVAAASSSTLVSAGMAGLTALNGITPANASVGATIGASVSAAKELAKEALAKAQMAAEVQRALAQLPHLQGGRGVMLPEPKQPTMVTIDAQGRLLDANGKVLQSTARPVATVKANQSARSNPLLEEAAPPEIRGNKYYDPRMGLPGQAREQRKKRSLAFVAEGHYTRKGEDLRAKAAVELMLAEANKPAAKRKAAASALAAAARAAAAAEGGAAAVEGAADVAGAGLSAASARMIERRLAEVPGAEWWDLPLLNASSYEGPPGGSLAANAVLEGISHLIEHPVPIAPPTEPPPPPPMPLPLTKRERKKLRTQRRLAAEKEKQDQIRCGLLAPPPAKVKISNLMTAMTNEAVADPSAVEAKVRSEMAQRMKNHEERNAARKLTPAERKAKKHRKLTNDPSGGGTPVSLYRLDQMPTQQKLYKIDKNAQQNHLTGLMVLMEEACLLVVEGGPKAQKRYRKLLMQRIDWADAPGDDEDDEQEHDDEARRAAAAEVCKLVWEGLVVKPQFRTFKVEAARAVDVARKLLKERGCEHYLDMALRMAAGEDGEDDDDDDDDDDDSEDDDDDDSEDDEGGGGDGGGGGGAEEAAPMDEDDEEG